MMSDDEVAEEILEDIQEFDNDNDEDESLTDFSGRISSPFLADLISSPDPYGEKGSLASSEGRVLESEEGLATCYNEQRHVCPRESDQDPAKGFQDVGVESFEPKGDLFKISRTCNEYAPTVSSGECPSVGVDESPVLSDMSVCSLGSHNDHSDPNNDRSLSEVSISVPKLTVVAVGSGQGVRSLVKQFSQAEGSSVLCDSEENFQCHSLPPHLNPFGSSARSGSQATPSSEERPLASKDDFYLGRTQGSNLSSSKSHGNVSHLVSHFSVDDESLCSKEIFQGKIFPSGLDKVEDFIMHSDLPSDKGKSVEESILGLNVVDDKASLSNGLAVGDTSLDHSISGIHCPTISDLDMLCSIAFPDSSNVDVKLSALSPTIEIGGKSSENSKDICEQVDSIPEMKDCVSDERDLMPDEDNNKPKFDNFSDAKAVLSKEDEPEGKDTLLDEEAIVPKVDEEENGDELPSASEVEVNHGLFPASYGNRSKASVNRQDSVCELPQLPDESENGDVAAMSPPPTPSQDSHAENNDTYDELLEIDIGDSDQEDLFLGDISDASEIILGFISKSPISAITERTEESGQDNEIIKLPLDETQEMPQRTVNGGSGDGCQSVYKDGGAETPKAMESPANPDYFASPSGSVVNDIASSQFTGISSMQEESLVQTQPSLENTNEMANNLSSQSYEASSHRRMKSGTKPKLAAKFKGYPKPNKRAADRCFTPPLSPTGRGGMLGPMKASCLQRVTSKSMHNLGPGSGGAKQQRASILRNRSFSLSTDHLDKQSPRAKSLSPGPVQDQRNKTGMDNRGQGNGGSLTRRCVSAVALNRSDSQASIIHQKNHQSVSLSRLNRSRSCSMSSVASWKRMDYSHIPSKVKQYIKDMKEKDIRNSTRSLPTTPARKALLSSQQNHPRRSPFEDFLFQELTHLDEKDIPQEIQKLKEQILKDRGDSKSLDQLLQLWAMERKLRYASDTTLSALQSHYDNLNFLYAEKQDEIDRLRFFKDVHIYKEYNFPLKNSEEKKAAASGRYSCHTTPPNTPHHKAIFHYLTSPNTPTRRSSLHTTPPNTPNVRSLSPTLASNPVKTTSTPVLDRTWSIAYDPNDSSAFLESSAGVPTRDQSVEDSVNGITLDGWMKEANMILKRVKEFALLEGSSALQQSERNVIWHSILSQYWRLSSQFPVLSLLPGSQQSGILVQNLGQAISGTASRFDLELMPSAYADHEEVTSEVVIAEHPKAAAPATADSRPVVTGAGSNISHWKEVKKDVVASRFLLGGSKDQVKSVSDVESIPFGKITKQMEDLPATVKTSTSGDKNENLLDHFPENTTTVNPELLEDIQVGEESCALEDIPGNTMEIKAADVDARAAALSLLSPSPSHESMKTVGPLEKVTMWQESLIGSIVPHGSYQPSSSLSPAPSLLSLGSSQPFDTPNDLDNCLTDLQLNDDIQAVQSIAVVGTDEDIKSSTKDPTIAIGRQDVNSGSNSLLNCPDRIDCDLPNNSTWRSGTAATPRLTLGRTIKARDLDSGCPGSERSTKISHNPSLELPEQLDIELPEQLGISNVNPSVKGLTVNVSGEIEDLPVSEENPCSGNLKKCKDSEIVITGSSAGRVKVKDGTIQPDDRLFTSKNSTKTLSSSMKLVIDGQEVEDQAAVGGYSGKFNDPNASINVNGTFKDKITPKHQQVNGITVKKLSGKSDHHTQYDKEEELAAAGCCSVKHTRRNRCPDQPGENSLPHRRNRSHQQIPNYDLSDAAPPRDGTRNKRPKSLTPIPKRSPKKEASLHKYDARYTAGNSSDSSEKSSNSRSTSSSSVDIHNNISKLKRDLNILKSQMMNLTTDVLQESKCHPIRHSVKNQVEMGKNSQKPIKANLEIRSASNSERSEERYSQNPMYPSPYACDDYGHSSPSLPARGDGTSLVLPVGYRGHHCLRYDSNSQLCLNSDEEKVFDAEHKPELVRSPCGKSKKKKKCARNPLKPEEEEEEQQHQDFRSNSSRKQMMMHWSGGEENMNAVRSTQQTGRGGVPRLPLVEQKNRHHVLVQTENVGFDKLVVGDGKSSRTHLEISTNERGNSSRSSPSPVIYIQNYNCGMETSKEASVDKRQKKKTMSHDANSNNNKCRRSGSSHNLMASLDQATTLAERLRLRSESMLSHLNMNISTHYDFGKS